MLQSREKDQIVDAILFSTLFYLLSHEGSYQMTKQMSFLTSDSKLILAILFGVIYLVIQKLTRRM
jgi:hypothetical protein